MSKINVRNLSNENEDGAPDIVGVTTFSATSYFVPTRGTTAQRPSNHVEEGSLRYNYDTKNLEYYRGNTLGWSQFELIDPDLGGGTGSNTGLGHRAVFAGGGVFPAFVNTISFLTISTLGNPQDFGDLNYKAQNMTSGHVSSTSRGIFAGGYGPGRVNTIEFVTIASTGNGTNFGDLTVNREHAGGGSNGTRGLFAGGFTNPNNNNVIDYITISSTGDAVDFGDLSFAKNCLAVCNSTRMVINGHSETTSEFITMSSTGNATDFGTVTSLNGKSANGDSSTRGIFAGGINTNIMEFITTATLGNATDFGDLTQARNGSGGTSSPTRMVIIGGGTGPSYPFTVVNTIDFVTIATTGNATDFGDTDPVLISSAAISNGHGGL